MNRRKVRKLWQLGATGWVMATETVLLTLAVRFGFAVAGAVRTASVLATWSQLQVPAHPDEVQSLIGSAVRLQRAVELTFGQGGTCLARSLVLKFILARRGVPTDLRIGIRKTGSLTEGHAWLENHGTPINESPARVESYVVFERASDLDFLRSFE